MPASFGARRALSALGNTLYVDPDYGNDARSGRSWGQAFKTTAPLFDRRILRPGMTVRQRPGSLGRFAWPSVPNVTLIGVGATVYGSEQIVASTATLVSGTKYKVATALHPPVTGAGAVTNAIFMRDTSGSPEVITAIARASTNAAADVTTGKWAMPGDGFLYFDIGRVPVVTDLLEVGQRSCFSVEHSGMRILGFTARFSESHIIPANVSNAYSGLEVGFCELAYAGGDGININAGHGLNNWFHDCIIRKTQGDGGGAGDAISAHQAGGGSGASGLIERVLLQDCGKTGIANDGDGTWTYRDIICDGACIAVDGAGSSYAGTHTFRRVGMANQWPNATENQQFFLIDPNTIANIDVVGLTIDRGGKGSLTLRGFRHQGGVSSRFEDVAIWGGGTAGGVIGAGLMSSVTTNERYVAIGGCDADRFAGWPNPGTNPITLSARPFAGSVAAITTLAEGMAALAPAAGSPGNPIRGTGVVTAGITTSPTCDVGVTAVPA